jgi:hypothetical protein
MVLKPIGQLTLLELGMLVLAVGAVVFAMGITLWCGTLPDCAGFLERLEIACRSVALVLIPIFVAFIGSRYTSAMKERELAKEYVAMASGILKGSAMDADKILQDWAVRVINRHSEIPIPPPVNEALRKAMTMTLKPKSLTVLDESGAPLAGAEVHLEKEVAGTITAVSHGWTDEHGRFGLEVTDASGGDLHIIVSLQKQQTPPAPTPP